MSQQSGSIPNIDKVVYTGNNTVPTGSPDKGVDTHVLANGDRYDRNGSSWIPVSSEDFFRSVIDNNKPNGTNDVAEGIYHDGTIHIGNANNNGSSRFSHLGIVSYTGNGTFGTQTIQTNIPANSYLMPTIFLKGYAYEAANTVDLQMSVYTYGIPLNSIYNPVWSSNGSTKPTQVRMAYIGGFLAIELTWANTNDYFQRWEVSAYCDGNNTSQTDLMFEGWTVTPAVLPVGALTITVVPDKTPSGGPTCPGPMTRAALIALRNAGGLSKDCHYIITNPAANGNLGLQKVLLHAVDENTLSGCYLFTTHDNTAWNGTYDIDTDRVEFVHDHLRNNRVHVNASIIVFPFGVAAVNSNVVESGGILTYNGGTVNNNSIRNLARVTVNSGTFRENDVSGESTVVTSSTTGIVEENDISGRATLTVTGTAAFARNELTSQSRVNTSKTAYRNNFTTYCIVTMSGAGSLEDSDIHNESLLNCTTSSNVHQLSMNGISTLTISGNAQLYHTQISENSQVTMSSQSNYHNVISGGSVYNQVGTGYLRYTTIGNLSNVTNGNTNIQNTTISDNSVINTTGATGDISSCTLGKAIVNAQNVSAFFLRESSILSFGSINSNNSARVYFFRSHLDSYGRLDVRTGSRVDASYTNVSANSYIQSTIAGGFLSVNNTEITANSYVRNTTPNAHSVSDCVVGGTSNMRFDGTATGGRIYYSSALSGTSMYQTTGSVNCYMYYVQGTSVAQIYTQTSTNVRMYYSSANSYSYLRAIGNATTTSMYYCNADARGYVQMLNNVGASNMYAINAEAQSIAELRGSTGNLYYGSFTAYFYAYVTRTTGTTLGAFGMGRRTATITNPVPVAPFASGSAWSNI